MSAQTLASQRHLVQIGKPLPFGVCDANGRLLLARGQAIVSEGQLEGLLDRGAVVDRSESEDGHRGGLSTARPPQLVEMWDSSMDHMGRLLRASTPGPGFEEALEKASKPILALIARDPELAILQVVRQEDGGSAQYASRHSVHTAIAVGLAAHRLGWEEAPTRCAFRAALTMNMSMNDLQNRLASQVTPLTKLQREQVQSHPQRSVEMLRMAGVTDEDWLEAVLHHHETPDGKGYPFGLREVSDAARLVQCADVFTAKFSGRGGRTAMRSDSAARQLFGNRTADPMVAALIKEFGLYPPGTAVQLKSGETAVVVKRGEVASAPVAMAVTNKSGEQLITPLRRDTSVPAHAISAVLPFASLRVRIAFDQLLAAAEGA